MKVNGGLGTLERRVADRVTLELDCRWKRLPAGAAKTLLESGGFSDIADFSDFEGALGGGATDGQVRTADLSVSGMQLAGDLRLVDGSALEKDWELAVDVLVPGQAVPIRTLARVVWVAPPGPSPRQAGLCFLAIKQADVERLVRLQVESLTAKTKLLEAERSKLAEDVVRLQNAQVQLLQGQKLEAIGQVAAGVAHDFNNILTIIGANAELLGYSLGPDHPERQSVLEIERAVVRASTLTKKLLAFSP
jgi:signal transduction histidine kinase